MAKFLNKKAGVVEETTDKQIIAQMTAHPDVYEKLKESKEAKKAKAESKAEASK